MHNFSQVPSVSITRSAFDLSHGLKTTFDSGWLVPVLCMEVLPGDSITLNPTMFARLATPAVPFMDNLTLTSFFFYCPNRLVWENFERFMGAQDDPGDSTDFLIPTLDTNNKSFDVGSIYDYFALPTGVRNLKNISALPFRMVNLIFNEWFRSQDLQNSLPVPKGDGPDSLDNYKLFRRGKRLDYFTGCLPFPQKGPGVNIPLGTTAPVLGTATVSGLYTRKLDPGSGTTPIINILSTNNTGSITDQRIDVTTGTAATLTVPAQGLYADLSSAQAATISTLRMAFQIQKIYEKDARYGTRFKELLYSHFGVISPDARLQRPEYLGGTSTRININPIAQTSSTDVNSPQGNLAAIGTGGSSSHAFTKSFVEHGYIIGFVNVTADLNYQQGVDRMWTRQTRFDFMWPALCHLGEQAVYNREIYAQGTDADDEVFGYQERYSEYRYLPSHITGKFRSTYAQSLDVWHLAQKFDNLPTLSAEFIEDKPPVERVVAVTDEPQFLLDCYFKITGIRPLPVYGTPGLIDHF